MPLGKLVEGVRLNSNIAFVRPNESYIRRELRTEDIVLVENSLADLTENRTSDGLARVNRQGNGQCLGLGLNANAVKEVLKQLVS